ncbi:hypothetical protein [Leptospira perdikensis]|nr:hypothetical protein [Leptospira perdikensis]
MPTITEYKPTLELNRYVESYLLIQCDESLAKSVIPHHSFVLTINL